MSEIRHRRSLREKEAKQVIDQFSNKLKFDIAQQLHNKTPHVEVSETAAGKIYFINGKPLMADSKGRLFPTLVFEIALTNLPRIFVNMGAVPHICNGADLMAPGIVRIEGMFKSDDLALVVDERYQKPLAIVMALGESQTISDLQHGKVAKNLHFVGDGLWSLLQRA